MAEDCRTSHSQCDGPEHDRQQSDTRGTLSEIMRAKASRRSFIKGVIASGATLGASGYLFRAGGAQARTAGVERMVSLKVNGQVRRVDVLPHETLANTLRYKLGLTGTKLGCDRGECGACTVMIDDVDQLLLLDAHARGAPTRRSRRSRGSPRTANCTRCRRRSSTSSARNAASARRAR